MGDTLRATELLVDENAALRQRIAALESAQAEHQRVEGILRNNLKFLTTLLDTIPGPIFYKNAQGIYQGCNEEFARQILGQPKEKIIGHSLYDMPEIIPHDLANIYHAADMNLIQNPGTQIYDMQVQCADGIRRDFVFYKATFTETTGDIAGMIGIMLDVSDRKQLEEQLRQSQKMEAVGQLASGIAHNFNNMLQGITGNLDLAMEALPEDLELFLNNAQLSARRSANMVEQLLCFSRQASQLEYCDIGIDNVIHETVAVYRATFDVGIDIVIELHQCPTVRGDAGQLHQVFLNLLLNARDALEARYSNTPTIEIEVASVAADTLCPPLEITTGPYVRVRMSDNGTGMDEETQRRIFDPFFTTKEVGKGTGLGLSIAFGLVAQHSGWIECVSELGAGSTFSVYLPVVDEESLDEPDPERVAAIPGGTETILLIADEALARVILSSLLEQRGYTVLVAQDGRAGAEVFERQHAAISLVLLDLSMPQMSGQEVLIALRVLVPEIKVIILSGYAAKPLRYQGARAFIKKPVEGQHLLLTVREVLDA